MQEANPRPTQDVELDGVKFIACGDGLRYTLLLLIPLIIPAFIFSIFPNVLRPL